jgi:hypothetical protein
LLAANSEMSGTLTVLVPWVKRRALTSVSRLFKMALLALKISSRNTTSASGSIFSMRRRYVPWRNAWMSTGPKISFGSVKRVSR